jgi:L,D-peptidoglycan transpeptidase YkuD (ErfK/YbiS/YcfS/YnhG family)
MWRSYIVILFAFLHAMEAANITVTWSPQDGNNGQLTFMGKTMKCSVGKHGVTTDKIEGDGCTPAGSYLLRRAFYRIDRIKIDARSFPTFLNLQATHPDYGWIDDVQSPQYNEFTYLPVDVSHEKLFLTDSNVYDLIAVVGYNDSPPIPGKGSAIFFHVTESYGPTAGCIALSLSDLTWVLSQVQSDTYMVIEKIE